jgi:hypothetical protein
MTLLLEHLKSEPFAVIEDLPKFVSDFLAIVQVSKNVQDGLTAFAERDKEARDIWRRGLATSFVQGWIEANLAPSK